MTHHAHAGAAISVPCLNVAAEIELKICMAIAEAVEKSVDNRMIMLRDVKYSFA